MGPVKKTMGVLLQDLNVRAEMSASPKSFHSSTMKASRRGKTLFMASFTVSVEREIYTPPSPCGVLNAGAFKSGPVGEELDRSVVSEGFNTKLELGGSILAESVFFDDAAKVKFDDAAKGEFDSAGREDPTGDSVGARDDIFLGRHDDVRVLRGEVKGRFPNGETAERAPRDRYANIVYHSIIVHFCRSLDIGKRILVA